MSLSEYTVLPLEERDAPAATPSPDPWLFAPRASFGCGGQARLGNHVYEDYPTATVWQPDVYAEAAVTASRIGARDVIDFGCGSGEKLLHFLAREGGPRLIGVDFKASLALARNRESSAAWLGCNLGLWADLARTTESLLSTDPQLLIASDVVEHLLDPRPLIATLRLLALGNPDSRVILSTPDRHRMHGPAANGPPVNRCHVREWTLGELEPALVASGFTVERAGYTRSHLEDEHRRTAFLELSVSSPDYAALLDSLPLIGDTARSLRFTARGGSDEWERLEQVLFFVPSLRQINVPVGSPGERQACSAQASGLLPGNIEINGRCRAVARQESLDVCVVLVVRNTRLDWLRDCLASLKNQSIDPREVLVVDLGSRLDYRMILPGFLGEALRVPYRILRRTTRHQDTLESEIEALTSAEFLAWIDGSCLPAHEFS